MASDPGPLVERLRDEAVAIRRTQATEEDGDVAAYLDFDAALMEEAADALVAAEAVNASIAQMHLAAEARADRLQQAVDAVRRTVEQLQDREEYWADVMTRRDGQDKAECAVRSRAFRDARRAVAAALGSATPGPAAPEPAPPEGCSECGKPWGQHASTGQGDNQEPVCTWPCLHERVPGETRCEFCAAPRSMPLRPRRSTESSVVRVNRHTVRIAPGSAAPGRYAPPGWPHP